MILCRFWTLFLIQKLSSAQETSDRRELRISERNDSKNFGQREIISGRGEQRARVQEREQHYKDQGSLDG